MVELTTREVAALKSSGQALKPAFQVGKSGVTDGVVEELGRWLDREPLVKLKILKSALDERPAAEVAAELAGRADATLVEVRGHTALFYKPPKSRRRRA